MEAKRLFDISNKIAIVTGGTGLFGQPISTALAEMGALVIIASRGIEKCKSVADELNRSGLKVEGAFVDLSDETSINDFVSGVLQKHLRIDILVNNSVSRE